MPLVDLLAQKWREVREERRLGEESRRRVFDSLNAVEKDRACREIIVWLKDADSSSDYDDDYYYSQAQERIAGFRWQLYRLNRPFVSLEKKVIEPLDRWSKRANVFQFFERVSPVIEAIGVLAIPILILVFEIRREERQMRLEEQREERQLKFERSLASAQADVRKQQAVREYLSQITDIYLEAKNPEEIKANENLNDLLEATTFSILDELSINEDSRSSLGEEEKSDLDEGDRRREVIKFLHKLNWIQGDEPLISLVGANLERANLRLVILIGVNLRGVNLIGAYLEAAILGEANLERAYLGEANLEGVRLWGANLEGADLRGANLEGASLRGAYLKGADLRGANLERVNLRRAYLKEADLRGAYLEGADLEGARFCLTTMPDGKINNEDCK